jgi:nucleoside-diphosphate-sugar epimerase
MPDSAPAGLTVAVTGPTGDIGKSVVRALERAEGVGRIVGMARRPFDPADHGWKRATYRRGDILGRDSVERLVDGADVVVHLAFVIFGSHEETRRVNLEGTRNVFEATAAAGVKRLVYTSSVAAYGFPESGHVLTEADEPRGTDSFYYSAQKAELEAVLRDSLAGSETEAYVFRPCVVAGADAPTIIAKIVETIRLGGRLGPVERVLGAVPGLKPLLPDTRVPFQLVHHDDVATAMRAAVLGRGEPGVYNLAGQGTLTMSDLADALGWYSVPVPELALGAAAELVARMPFVPAEAQWIESLRHPVLMDTAKARRELRWRPEHDAHETLVSMVEAARLARLIR